MSVIDEQSCPALVAGARMRIDAVTQEPVLVFPEGVMHLNTTAHEVLSRCDGKSTVTSIIESLAVEYEVAADELRADVLECLADLRGQNLIAFKT
jgi:pyrroloquinoline quinone biosynthesis protein D